VARFDAGTYSAPAFADLDGDLDLYWGDEGGTFLALTNLPEPASSLALGAGAGLLGWLARRRRRISRSTV
jgi:hypothetical protein